MADRTQRYWAITFGGYAINLLAVPLLALAGNWPLAAGLLVVERIGKALRTPARDACSNPPSWSRIPELAGPVLLSACVKERGLSGVLI